MRHLHHTAAVPRGTRWPDGRSVMLEWDGRLLWIGSYITDRTCPIVPASDLGWSRCCCMQYVCMYISPLLCLTGCLHSVSICFLHLSLAVSEVYLVPLSVTICCSLSCLISSVYSVFSLTLPVCLPVCPPLCLPACLYYLSVWMDRWQNSRIVCLSQPVKIVLWLPVAPCLQYLCPSSSSVADISLCVCSNFP